MIRGKWYAALKPEFSKEYYSKLYETVVGAYQRDTVYPPSDKLYSALEYVSAPEDVKCIIMGQNPYHGKGQANGLAFSVNPEIKVPPSLENIYKEIIEEYKKDYPALDRSAFPNGNLEYWAKQGVLLLNSSLTVLEGQPNSHLDIGWQNLTDAIVQAVFDAGGGQVVMLWGNNARSLKTRIKIPDDRLVLESAHPSPLSASRGFFGNGHFRKCNSYLTEKGKNPVAWFPGYFLE